MSENSLHPFFYKLETQVELNKKDIINITILLDKMEKLIDKMVKQQENMIDKVYEEMSDYKIRNDIDIKELNKRINSMNQDLLNRIERSEGKLMNEMNKISRMMDDHIKDSYKKDPEQAKINKYFYMILGGGVFAAWVLGKILPEIFQFFKH